MAITKTTETYNRETQSYDKRTETYAEGCVLRSWMGSVQVMSDIWEPALYAEYWCAETQSVKTDLWLKEATVDATPEIVAKAEAWLFKNVYDLAFAKRKAFEEREARKIVKECRVRVVAGRTAKGVEGKVAVIITRAYGMGYRASMEEKLAVATSDTKIKVPAKNGKVYENYKDVEWVWARNCERVDVPEIDLEIVKEAAKNEATYEVKSRRWCAPARA